MKETLCSRVEDYPDWRIGNLRTAVQVSKSRTREEDQGMKPSSAKRLLSSLEKVLVVCGLLLVAVCLALRLDAALGSRAELQQFWNGQRTAFAADDSTKTQTAAGMPLLRRWSKERIAARG